METAVEDLEQGQMGRAASRAQKEVFNPKRNHTDIGEGVSPQKEPHRH